LAQSNPENKDLQRQVEWVYGSVPGYYDGYEVRELVATAVAAIPTTWSRGSYLEALLSAAVAVDPILKHC
jgi:hypothetical protein